MRPSGVRPTRQGGFSIVELLVVVGIIGIMAAVALPAIAQYMRVFKIRGAAQQVMQEIATARAKAIGKNTNNGVLFIVLAPGTPGNPSPDVGYRYVLEDSWNGALSGHQATTNLLTTVDPVTNTNPQVGPLRVLPFGIRFEAPTAGVVNDRGFRFDRLGALCDPDPGTMLTCPALDAGTNYVYIDPLTLQAKVTLRQRVPDNGLAAQITVERGGRVNLTQSWDVK